MGAKQKQLPGPSQLPQRTLNQTGEPSAEQGCRGGHPTGLERGAGTLIPRQKLSRRSFPRGPSEVRGQGHLHRAACQQASGHREGPLRGCGHGVGAGRERLWRFPCRSSVGSWGGGGHPPGVQGNPTEGTGPPQPSQDPLASNPPGDPGQALRLGKNHASAASALCPGAAPAGSLRREQGSRGRRDFLSALQLWRPGSLSLSWSSPRPEQGQETGHVCSRTGRTALEKPQRRRFHGLLPAPGRAPPKSTPLLPPQSLQLPSHL